MRLPWPNSQPTQPDLLSDEPVLTPPAPLRIRQRKAILSTGSPRLVRIEKIDEDPANPRIEFSEIEIEELACDVRMRGILVPLVVHPADASSRHLLHFGDRMRGLEADVRRHFDLASRLIAHPEDQP